MCRVHITVLGILTVTFYILVLILNCLGNTLIYIFFQMSVSIADAVARAKEVFIFLLR